MQYIQSLKRLISLCLVSVILLTSTITIFPSSARADEVTASPNSQALVCLSINKEMLEQAKAKDEITFSEDMGALGFIGTLSSAAAAANLGSITILTTTTTAHGILALLGASTTTVVAVPVAGAVAVGGLLAYGGYKVVEYMQSQGNNHCSPLILPANSYQYSDYVSMALRN